MAEVFISYRRQDAKAIAGRIFDRLEARFGRDAVFMDIDSIPPGVDFPEWLSENVAQASVVLALIGHAWVDARDEQGQRRLDNPNDFVRIEIEAALARKIPVVPLLIDGAPFPRIEELPTSLQPLTRRNAAFLDAGRDFNVHIARLIAAVEPYLKRGKSTGTEGSSKPQLRLQRGGAAERDWEREQIAAIEDVEIIQAYIKQYAQSEPLWVAKARRRLKAVEARIAERAEKERSAREEAERKQTEARFKAEGRIEIAAPFVTNPNGRWFLPAAGKTEWFKDFENGPEMVIAPLGRFLMGSPKDEPQRESWQAGTESPQDEVTIPKPFAIGRCAVTRGQFAAFVATGQKVEGGAYVWTGSEWKKESWRDPGFTQDDTHPVVCVNWDDAQAYVAWLSWASGASYRLPSEAEWEYACRAGSVTPFWLGASITPDQANYDGNYTYDGGGKKGEYRKRTVPARSFEVNPWGLYQVHGNVWEWCEDLWHASYSDKPAGLKTTGEAWTTGDGGARVRRGGSWNNRPQNLRSAYRYASGPDIRSSDIGFRVARTLNP
jgi:formylglycine-generating enzyme required for sulfatase activity